jgi:hypothetical protein
MSAEKAFLEQLSQKGFVNVDKWPNFRDGNQLQLLDVLRNDPQATELR